jgi:hypothetical protein
MSGLVDHYDAAVDPKTNDLIIVAAMDDGVHVASRSTKMGAWSASRRLETPSGRFDVSVRPAGNRSFIVRTSQPAEFLINLTR